LVIVHFGEIEVSCVIVPEDVVIDCDDPRLASDEETEGIYADRVGFLSKKHRLNDAWILRN